MKTRRIVLIAVVTMAAFVAAAVILHSCSSGGGSSHSGSVAMYVTDSMSDYKQVLATVNRIELLHTGSGDSCTVFTGPLTLDIANLAGVMQLINVGPCPASPFNRIHIEFAKSVALMDAAGNTSTCAFSSYKDDNNNPNTLACGADVCALDINGAVNVLADKQNKFALDFDLKNFDVVSFGSPSTCSVTMKVSPLHAGEIETRNSPESITGLISNLSTTGRAFTLTRGNATFTVLYSGITSSQQPGLGALLQRAQDDQLRVKVTASQIDFSNHSITATAVYVKVEGTIAAGSLNTTSHAFTVNYKSGKSIGVDYGTASVEGALSEGIWVDVKLYGFDGGKFLARSVEVEANETMTED